MMMYEEYFTAHLQCISFFKSIVMTEVTTILGIYDFVLRNFGHCVHTFSGFGYLTGGLETERVEVNY